MLHETDIKSNLKHWLCWACWDSSQEKCAKIIGQQQTLSPVEHFLKHKQSVVLTDGELSKYPNKLLVRQATKLGSPKIKIQVPARYRYVNC